MKISRTVQLADLYRLGEQIEDDRSVSLQALRQRDHDIGLQCEASGDVARLQYWLDHVPRPDDSRAGRGGPFTSERSIAVIARLVAAILGFLAMSTFLLASGRGLVNVFVFLLLFVLVQFLFSVTALSLMLLSGRGNPPVMLPINPARLFVSRIFPDGRYLRECQSVLRLLLLRYGQEFGALFTLAAMAAFLGVLAFSQFTFVWSSTFNLSDALVGRLTDLLATPWSSWLPGATLSDQTIADTRYHPALTHLDRETIASMRGWWPFLGMSMLTYALLPRVILWLLSRVIYTKTATRSLTRYPGPRVFSRE